ncbi:MAG TPA: hypothetical protein VF656_11250 [Pyrinomonadaceae bacterium]|jgi:hypothetical protein
MSKLIKIIAALEVLGGVCGIAFVAWSLIGTAFDFFPLLLALVVAFVYLLSLVAGVALWRGDAFGRRASIVVQTVQIPKLISPLLTFGFSFGLDLWAQWLLAGNFSRVGVEFRVLAFYTLYINMPSAPMGLGVSLTACLFLAALFKYQPHATPEEIIAPPPPPAHWEEEETDKLTSTHTTEPPAPPATL